MLSNTLELSHSLRLAIARASRRLRQQSRGGLTPSQRSVISTLDRHGPMTMSELAEVESIAAPSATGIVSRLVDRGLVERQPHSVDRRCSVVGLTDEGRAELQAIREERNVFLANWLDSLDSEEREALARAAQILDRLVEAE